MKETWSFYTIEHLLRQHVGILESIKGNKMKNCFPEMKMNLAHVTISSPIDNLTRSNSVSISLEEKLRRP